MCTGSVAPCANCRRASVLIFTAKNVVFWIYWGLILVVPRGLRSRSTIRLKPRVLVLKRVLEGLVNYLEGAVHEGFVQVDHHAVLAKVICTDLWQKELVRRLQRQCIA